uniref:Uncharacterized protein n=1 Tax=Sphaerodactylus townsendi TaxID=933632 RepID=A0ACB8FMW6_9SAUR
MTMHPDQSATLQGSGTTASLESRCINYNTGKLFFNESHCDTFYIELFLSFLCPEGGEVGLQGNFHSPPFFLLSKSLLPSCSVDLTPRSGILATLDYLHGQSFLLHPGRKGSICPFPSAPITFRKKVISIETRAGKLPWKRTVDESAFLPTCSISQYFLAPPPFSFPSSGGMNFLSF